MFRFAHEHTTDFPSCFRIGFFFFIFFHAVSRRHCTVFASRRPAAGSGAHARCPSKSRGRPRTDGERVSVRRLRGPLLAASSTCDIAHAASSPLIPPCCSLFPLVPSVFLDYRGRPYNNVTMLYRGVRRSLR